jgi:hypothetical protein
VDLSEPRVLTLGAAPTGNNSYAGATLGEKEEGRKP